MHVSLKNFQINHVLFCTSFAEKQSSSSPQWAVVSKLIQHCCALSCGGDACREWFKVTLVYRSIQFATVPIVFRDSVTKMHLRVSPKKMGWPKKSFL